MVGKRRGRITSSQDSVADISMNRRSIRLKNLQSSQCPPASRKRSHDKVTSRVDTNTKAKCKSEHVNVPTFLGSARHSKRIPRHRSALISPCKRARMDCRPSSFTLPQASILPSAGPISSFMLHNQSNIRKNRQRSLIRIREPHRQQTRRANSCNQVLKLGLLAIGDATSTRIQNRKHRNNLLKSRRFDKTMAPLSPRNSNLLMYSSSESQSRLMELLGQNVILSWHNVFDSSAMKKLSKIGEGVYGEVYQSGGPVGDVIKIFPVEGQQNIMDGSRSQMTFHGVFPEIYVSKCLAELSSKNSSNMTSGFALLKRGALIQGKLPDQFVREWNKYDATHSSENICLDYLPDDQLWMVLIYEYAGVALVTYQFANYSQLHSVVTQLCLSMAAAEAELQFEHRDLHWGNVLIRPTALRELHFRVLGVDYHVFTCGVRATIIDFTVSRMSTRDGGTVYVNLSENPDIFCTYDDEYQSEIYRMMRTLNKDNWSAFHGKSNLIWLHYLCERLLYHVHVADTRSDEASYGELLAMEEDLRRVVNPPPSCISFRAPALSTRQAVRRFAPGYPSTSLRCRRRRVLPLNCQGAVELVSRSTFFDNCRDSVARVH